MEIKTNGDYNRCQLNETINLSPDGKVLSKSLMLNLRGETTEEVWKCYQELKGLVDGEEDKPEKQTKNNPGKEKKQNKKEQKKDENVCLECGGPMIERRGISKKGYPYAFKGCGNWPSCNYTEPLTSEAEEHMPCDEEIPIEAIPF